MRSLQTIICSGSWWLDGAGPTCHHIGGAMLDRRVIVPSIARFLHHDRACELFYQLVGGTVDYGKEHSGVVGHNRYGRTFPGFYPCWNEEHPLHFLSHSIGSGARRSYSLC